MENSGVKKGPWTPEEDEKLIDYISKHGHGSWRTLSKHAGLNRCGKSCRLRWTNYLRPDIKRGKFTEEEEKMIINLHSVLGNKWSKIAAHLPGRTDNEIKNFWNTHLRKKLLRMGIDPETHKPRTDFNHLINLSQLLGMSSNLLGNPLTGLQADFTTQLARLQVLQNLLQIMNSNNSFVNMGNNNPYLFGNHPSLLNPLDAFLSGTNTLQNKEPVLIRGQEYANPGLFSQAHSYSSQQDISKSWTDLEDGSNPQVLGYNNLNSNTTSHENSLPALVATSCPRKRSFNQMDNSSSKTIFEGWEKFLDDETTSGSYWKEILEWAPLFSTASFVLF